MSDELGELRTVVDDACAAVSADEAIERSHDHAPSAGFHRPARSRPHLMVVGAAAAFVVIGGLIWHQSTGPSATPVDVVPAQQRPTTTLGPSPTEASDCPADMPEEFLTTSSLPFEKSVYLMGTTCGHMTGVAADDDGRFERFGWVSIDEMTALGPDQTIPVYDDRGTQIAWWASEGLGWVDLDEAAAPGWNVRSAARAEHDEMVRSSVENGYRIGMMPGTEPPRGLIPDLDAPDRRGQSILFLPNGDGSLDPTARLGLTFVIDRRAEQSLAVLAEQRGATVTEFSDRPYVIFDDGNERVAVWVHAGVLLVTSRSVGLDDASIISLVDTLRFF